MFTQAEIEYIQKQLARGLNRDAIKNKLIDAGWEEGDIKDGFKEIDRLAPKVEDVPVVSESAVENSALNQTPTEPIIQTESITPKKSNTALKVSIAVVIFLIIGIAASLAYYFFVYKKTSVVDSDVQAVTTVGPEESVDMNKNEDLPPVSQVENNIEEPTPVKDDIVPTANSEELPQVVSTTSASTL